MQEAFENLNNGAQYHLNQYQPNKPKFAVYEIEDYLKKYDKKMRKNHASEYHKITWFKKGMGRYFVDFKAYDIIANTLFFITKEQVCKFWQK